ncbi:MAG: hypothetical protein ACFFDN_21635 [Candidatus Hodarchaeota archaeon]
MKKAKRKSGDNRKYINIYFQDGNAFGREKKDFTIGFSGDDPNYEKYRKLGSPKIKSILGIHSYSELVHKAKEEERPIGNYIKYRLKKYFESKNE